MLDSVSWPFKLDEPRKHLKYALFSLVRNLVLNPNVTKQKLHDVTKQTEFNDLKTGSN